MPGKQSAIYNSYLEKYWTTHKKVELIPVPKVALTYKTCVANTSNDYGHEVEVHQLPENCFMSKIIKHGWIYEYFIGDYREVLNNTPMPFNVYFEF